VADLTFISDLHLGRARQPVEGQFLALLAKLGERARAGRSQQLYVLGDLFSFWAERPALMRRRAGRALDALGGLVRAGCPVSILDGNRDFGYGRVIREAAGVEPLGERAVIEQSGRRALLIHGDELLTADRRYQLFKRAVRSRPARLAARWLPGPLVLGVVSCLERFSSRENTIKPPSILEPDLAEAGRLMDAAKADVLVCGHTHRPGETKLTAAGDSRRLLVLGNWGAGGGVILEWPEGGEPRLVPWPPALEGTPS